MKTFKQFSEEIEHPAKDPDYYASRKKRYAGQDSPRTGQHTFRHERKRLIPAMYPAIRASSMPGEPTADQISDAWTKAIELANIPGAGTTARHALSVLRGKKHRWFGQHEVELRASVDRYLGS